MYVYEIIDMYYSGIGGRYFLTSIAKGPVVVIPRLNDTSSPMSCLLAVFLHEIKMAFFPRAG